MQIFNAFFPSSGGLIGSFCLLLGGRKVVTVLNIHTAAAGVRFSRVVCFNPDFPLPVDPSQLGAKADIESAAPSESLRLLLSDSTLKIYLTGLRRNR